MFFARSKGGTIGRLRSDERGNVAVIFGAVALPTMFVLGAAVDYGNAMRARGQLQSAVDAAAMAAVTAVGKTNAERQTLANNVFSANVSDHPLTTGAQATVTISSGASTVTSSYNVPTAFARIIGVNEIPVSVTSTVASAGKKLEMSLMLDITGSMNDPSGSGSSKLEDLKAVAPDLLNIVMPDGGTDGVSKVAMVPFSAYVNPGSLVSAATGYAATGTTYSCNYYGCWGTGTGNLRRCVTERQGTNAYTDAAPSSGNGYVGHPYSNTSRYKSDANCYVSSGSSSVALAEVKPLTSDKASLVTAINNLQGAGGTAGHLGTAWAWYMISPNWASILPPTSAPALYTDNTVIKAAVLMTDGEYNTDYTSGVDSKQQALSLCQNMRNQGIMVFTVGFGLNPNDSSDAVAVDTLTQCAGGIANRYFFPYDRESLRRDFQTIGQQITSTQGKTRFTN